ncbi:hypothetical protein HDU96_003459 [Phlyctochytrium bullatum]|nr:hypothetical protein HDU96_003459 [Phlyctochytrium bullatum]
MTGPSSASLIDYICLIYLLRSKPSLDLSKVSPGQSTTALLPLVGAKADSLYGAFSNNIDKVVLVSDDRLLLYQGNVGDFNPMDMDLTQWESVQFCSFSENGHNIAIAGRRGLAHYNLMSNRWKLFGNELQEQEFAVSSGGILWCDDIIIASTEDTTTWDHEEAGGWEHIGLSEKVEYFWLSSSTLLKGSLWAVDGSGAKTHLLIPAVLRHFVAKDMHTRALDFANEYLKVEYFYHSLEMVLHEVLEEEYDSKIGNSDKAILPKLIKFLENFKDYLDVIVQCARKTEVKVWDYFFSIVGDPKALFETLEPLSVSGKMAVDLLEKAFELKEFEVGNELIRFFSSIQGVYVSYLFKSINSALVIAAFDLGIDGEQLNAMIRSTVAEKYPQEARFLILKPAPGAGGVDSQDATKEELEEGQPQGDGD